MNEVVHARVASGRSVLHLASGDSGLPLHPALAEELRASAAENAYGPVAGPPELLEAAAGYFRRRRLATDPDMLVATPGTKAALYALALALDGDAVIVPQPAWSSYVPQLALAGKHAIPVPVPDDCGGVPDPRRLAEAVVRAKRSGRPSGLIVTIPDNPTGTLASRSAIAELVAVAREHDLVVLSDELYRDLVYDKSKLSSPAELADELTVVIAGPSKSVAVSGWRVGIVRFPDTPLGLTLRRRVLAIASEIWSCLASPIGRAARLAFEEPADLREFTEAATALHRDFVSALHERVVGAGAACRQPRAAFFLYPNLGRFAAGAARTGVGGSAQLAALLLERFGVAVLAGELFGDPPTSLTFRMSASRVYGTTDDERWEALAAAKDGTTLQLPRLRAALDRAEAAIATLTAEWAAAG